MRNDYGNRPRAKMMGGGAMMKKPMMKKGGKIPPQLKNLLWLKKKKPK